MPSCFTRRGVLLAAAAVLVALASAAAITIVDAQYTCWEAQGELFVENVSSPSGMSFVIEPNCRVIARNLSAPQIEFFGKNGGVITNATVNFTDIDCGVNRFGWRHCLLFNSKVNASALYFNGVSMHVNTSSNNDNQLKILSFSSNEAMHDMRALVVKRVRFWGTWRMQGDYDHATAEPLLIWNPIYFNGAPDSVLELADWDMSHSVFSCMSQTAGFTFAAFYGSIKNVGRVVFNKFVARNITMPHAPYGQAYGVKTGKSIDPMNIETVAGGTVNVTNFDFQIVSANSSLGYFKSSALYLVDPMNTSWLVVSDNVIDIDRVQTKELCELRLFDDGSHGVGQGAVGGYLIARNTIRAGARPADYVPQGWYPRLHIRIVEAMFGIDNVSLGFVAAWNTIVFHPYTNMSGFSGVNARHAFLGRNGMPGPVLRARMGAAGVVADFRGNAVTGTLASSGFAFFSVETQGPVQGFDRILFDGSSVDVSVIAGYADVSIFSNSYYGSNISGTGSVTSLFSFAQCSVKGTYVTSGSTCLALSNAPFLSRIDGYRAFDFTGAVVDMKNVMASGVHYGQPGETAGNMAQCSIMATTTTNASTTTTTTVTTAVAAPGGTTTTVTTAAGAGGTTQSAGTTAAGGTTQSAGTTAAGGTTQSAGTTAAGTTAGGGTTAAGGTTQSAGTTAGGGTTAAGGTTQPPATTAAGGTTQAAATTTRAPTTAAPPVPTTTRAPTTAFAFTLPSIPAIATWAPGELPPGLLKFTLSSTAKASFDSDAFRKKLAADIGYPEMLLGISKPTEDGTVVVALIGANQTQTDAAVKKAVTLDSSQLNALGASAVVDGKAPAEEAPALELWMIIVIAVGGALLIGLIVFAVIKMKNGGGKDYDASENSGGGGLLNHEMAQQPSGAGANIL